MATSPWRRWPFLSNLLRRSCELHYGLRLQRIRPRELLLTARALAAARIDGIVPALKHCLHMLPRHVIGLSKGEVFIALDEVAESLPPRGTSLRIVVALRGDLHAGTDGLENDDRAAGSHKPRIRNAA